MFIQQLQCRTIVEHTNFIAFEVMSKIYTQFSNFSVEHINFIAFEVMSKIDTQFYSTTSL